MFDVVTDIPRTAEIEVMVGTFAGRLSAMAPTGPVGHPDAAGMRLKEGFAQPAQVIGLGQALAYLDRVAPAGCEGTDAQGRRR